MKLSRDFELEVFYGQWEFSARYNISSTDMQSMSISELLEMTGTDPQELLDVHLGYTETWGSPRLRAAIAGTFATMKPQDVLTFSGSEESIFCLMHALLTADDHAIVIVPAYQSAETVPMSICDVTGVALDRDTGWSLDLNELEQAITPSTKLLYMNFPNNPTGRLITEDELREIVALCRRHGIWLVSDEIFRGSETDETCRLPAVADIYERGFSLSGTSKMYGLAGLRIGWIVSPDVEALKRVERFKHYTTICSSAPSELLTTLAVRSHEQLFRRTRTLRQRYMERFDRFFGAHEATFEWSIPEAGLFAFPRYCGPGTADEFCANLLEKMGVLLVPGSLFRSELAAVPEDHVRVGFTRPETEEALDRLDEILANQRP